MNVQKAFDQDNDRQYFGFFMCATLYFNPIGAQGILCWLREYRIVYVKKSKIRRFKTKSFKKQLKQSKIRRSKTKSFKNQYFVRPDDNRIYEIPIIEVNTLVYPLP